MLETFVTGTPLSWRMKDAKSSVALTGADGDVVHVTRSSAASLEADPTAKGGAELKLVEPSKVELTSTLDGVPSQFHGTVAVHTKGSLEFTMQAGDRKVSVRLQIEQDIVATAGGEVPEVPAADPARPSVRIVRSVQWKAGDTVTDSGSAILSISETPVDEKGKAGKTTGKLVTTTWSNVRRCEAADADGVPTTFTVWVREWKSEEAGASDECLKGAVVDVTAKGWRLRAPEPKTSAAARAWLARECGSAAAVAGDDSMRAVVTPFTSVAVGESWEPDPVAASAIVRRWIGMPVDASGATASATLERSDGPEASLPVGIAYCIDGPISCVAGCSCSTSEVLEGGRFSVKGHASGVGADWTRRGTLDEQMTGSVSVQTTGDAFNRVAITQTRTRTRAPGGEVSQQ